MEDLLAIFVKHGRIKDDESHENVAAIGRNQSRSQYSEIFHDELEREDRKLMTTRYPELTVDPRRRQELADGGIVREDRRGMANLSNTAIHHEYPRLGYYSNPYIDSLTVVKAKKGVK